MEENVHILPIRQTLSLTHGRCSQISMGRYGSPKGGGKTPKIAIGGTMAAVPGVSIQCASPAGELSISAQHGANQPQAERPKPEEGTGEHAVVNFFPLDSTTG